MAMIDEVLQRLRERAARPLGDGRVTEEDVRTAEAVLGAPLPPSYRAIVTSCGPGDLPHGLYWLGPTLPPGLDLLRINRIAPLPKFLIAVCGDGGGDEFCFDTRHPDAEGEYPIVRWDHEIHDERSSEFERLANDLGEFLLPALR